MILWRNIEFSIFIILIPTPDFPHFYHTLVGNLGSVLYGDVSLMLNEAVLTFTQNLCFEEKYHTFSSENDHFYSREKIAAYCIGIN